MNLEMSRSYNRPSGLNLSSMRISAKLSRLSFGTVAPSPTCRVHRIEGRLPDRLEQEGADAAWAGQERLLSSREGCGVCPGCRVIRYVERYDDEPEPVLGPCPVCHDANAPRDGIPRLIEIVAPASTSPDRGRGEEGMT
jgi:hypothetical protein